MIIGGPASSTHTHPLSEVAVKEWAGYNSSHELIYPGPLKIDILPRPARSSCGCGPREAKGYDNSGH